MRTLKSDDLYCDKSITPSQWPSASLLVERLGEGGGGSDVGIAGSLVGTSGLLEGLSVSKVGGAVGLVGSGVVGLKVDIEELGEHLDVVLEAYFSTRVVAILIARCAAVLTACARTSGAGCCAAMGTDMARDETPLHATGAV